MAAIAIDADALFRAVIAHDYKIVAHYLDLRSGEIVGRTLNPDEVRSAPPGPSVAPLPVMGGDLNVRSISQPFGAPPETSKNLKGLFGDDQAQEKKDPFRGDFWKRGTQKKLDPFGGEGIKRESGAKKLAELFGDTTSEKKQLDPFATSHSNLPAKAAYAPEIDETQPFQRIPAIDEAQHKVWREAFARDCGDVEIKEKLLRALQADMFSESFDKVLRNYQRMNQQWENWFRKQALYYARIWLKAMPVQWELVDK